MIGLLDGLKLGAGAVAGFVACLSINALVWQPAAEREARAAERASLQAATTIAIGELSNEADKARVRRRLCIERGGLYLNATGECLEKPTANDG
ncbi:putative membrane protein [Neorhizobium huautlense]|uniref:Membrane protein n=1 Tax=Neorhizobium huautlense TaxID=67774 RepID=A0ABT9PUS3_9HYPH|nr:hypothetical protein [Neorhizobium huautlense]MDP9837619.1 putative membrane protein [Neorhizobium huautlense]